MQYIQNFIFLVALVLGVGFFVKNIKKLSRNINLGKDVDRSDNKPQRWKNMAKIALGQYKMVKRPVSGILHVVVYVGFIIINIEVLEIIIDGLFGTHRVFSFLGGLYDFLIGSFEILAFLVLVAVIIFWLRRNVIKIQRFLKPEMKGWPKSDGNIILYFEVVLMGLFLTMNAADLQLQTMGAAHYASADGSIMGSFPISSFITPLFEGMSESALIIVERAAWWIHILGILVFLNYLYYSKHLHILLAFPNTWYAKLKPQGEFNNLQAVTDEVMLMMDPNADPFAAPPEGAEEAEVGKFGASDVTDLNWVQLMNSYSCTECGRCTSECPANQTGKKLSPRKIMMDTRDRLEEVGKNIDSNNGVFVPDNKQLLDDYITKEELWACTTCNACVEACPIGIDPLSIIVDMRRYMVMEESAAPTDLNNAMSNIENNGAPWPFNQLDRGNWINEG
ncbi:4Fe-4S dicluster domain-containing protein [uncultured Dokdonia sp.]|uniref:4Fe-4S dicluster domain-containing protein n=1 Tax=Dokdonia sp. Asnod2-E02 TaxID=3160574 RepID=UPI00261BCF78|nr:4Fe-4S dicluster domain-containing protein [uncultured Dokdonia sp.]